MSNTTGGRNAPHGGHGRGPGSATNVSSGSALSKEEEPGRQATAAGSSADTAASFPSWARTTGAKGSPSQENGNEAQDQRHGKPVQERMSQGSTSRGGPDVAGMSSLQPPNARQTSSTMGHSGVYKGNGECGADKRGDLKKEDYPPQQLTSSTFPALAPASVAASRTPPEDNKKIPYFEQDEGKRLPLPQDQQYATFPGMAAMSAVSGPPTQDEEKHIKRFEGETSAPSPPSQDQQCTMFPALAEPSVAAPGTPPQDKKKQYSKIDDKGRPSDDQPVIIQQHDDTVSPMRDTEVVTQSMSRRNQDGDGGDGSQQSSSHSPRPSGFVPVEFPARVGAYAIDGFGDGNTGWESSTANLESAEQLSSPEPGASSSEGQDHAVVANAVTTDDLENRMRSRLMSEAVTAEVVTETVTPNWYQPFYKTKWFLVFVGILVLAAIVAIVGGLVASRGNSGPPLTASPTRVPSTIIPTVDVPRPTMGPTVDFVGSTIALVGGNSFDGGSALTNSSSPQYKALDWMIRNGNLLGEYDEDRILQRFALITFFFSTSGTRWDSNTFWLSDEHECNWRSESTAVSCSDGKLISSLALTDNNLVGTLPPELALLSSSLATMDLSLNSLPEPIPTMFGSLTNLETIDLDMNSLSGPIPSAFGSLTNLEELNLRFNDLSSSIPSQIGLMSSLKRLQLRDNNLNGAIPTEIGQLSNRLASLYLQNNDLTGVIPSEIGSAASLELLLLHNNTLTGTIPSEINGMTNLDRLYLHDNSFTPLFACPDIIRACYVSCPCCSGRPECREL